MFIPEPQLANFDPVVNRKAQVAGNDIRVPAGKLIIQPQAIRCTQVAANSKFDAQATDFQLGDTQINGELLAA